MQRECLHAGISYKEYHKMKELKREVRMMVGENFQPRMREAAEGVESRTIEGYAIVFERESVLLADWWENYHEIIHAGAITQEEVDGMDITMDMYHNREKLLARSRMGEGTMRLTVDEVGLRYEFEAPKTADGDAAIELVKRGDLVGSSFVFWCDEQSDVKYTKDENDLLVRHVNHIGKIYSLTIAANPAYSETTVTAREVESHGIVLKPVKDIEAEAAAMREKVAKRVAEIREAAGKRIF